MSPALDSVRSDPSLPRSADVVVIGGGIVGACAAYFLAERNFSVALIEKGRIGAEQSSRNWGWVRQTGKALAELPLAMQSLEIWRRLREESGIETGFRQTGSLMVADDAGEIAGWESWRERAQGYGPDSRILTASEIAALLPGSARRWRAGLYSGCDGRAEPGLAAPAFAEAARRLGATIHQDCAARGMETRGGRISGVVTEKGTIATDTVICAAGAWTSMFCRWHGITLPQAGVFATACRTEPTDREIGVALGCDSFSVRRREDGGYTVALRGRGRLELTPQGLRHAGKFLPLFRLRAKNLTVGVGRSFFNGPESMKGWALDGPSPFEAMRVLDPGPDQKLVDRAMGQFKAAFPQLGGLRVAQSWGGFIESSPDALPVISKIDKLPGFVVATGFSGKGFGTGPAAGQLAADLATNGNPKVDPGHYRYGRLFDGTMKAASGWV